MTPSKKKICKPNYKAVGAKGCGEMKYIKLYGLCASCLMDWAFNNENGKIWYQKQFKPKVDKRIQVNKRKQHTALKKEIESKSSLEKKLQTEVNKIARLIDFDKGCISCDHGHESTFTRQKHGGHYFSVGSNPTLRFNLNNIHLQCSICNNHKSGNERNYRIGLFERYGAKYLEKVEKLRSRYPLLKLSKEELRVCITKAKKIVREIESGKDYTREEVNNILSIYL